MFWSLQNGFDRAANDQDGNEDSTASHATPSAFCLAFGRACRLTQLSKIEDIKAVRTNIPRSRHIASPASELNSLSGPINVLCYERIQSSISRALRDDLKKGFVLHGPPSTSIRSAPAVMFLAT